MNIPVFQLPSILLYMKHGEERQSFSAKKNPERPLIVPGELHPKREKLEDQWMDGWMDG